MSDWVHAILEDPERDEPRLVYADHLCQRGDPRGELIALQIAVRRGRGHAEARARVAELIDACWPELSRVPKAIGAQRFCVRRGFVEGLRIDAQRLADLPEIMGRAPVMEVEVCGARDGVLQLSKMRAALRLRVLELNGMGLGNKRFIALLRSGALANLRSLDVTGNGLGPPAIEALVRSRSHMPCLERVRVEPDRLGDFHDDPLFHASEEVDDGGVWFP